MCNGRFVSTRQKHTPPHLPVGFEGLCPPQLPGLQQPIGTAAVAPEEAAASDVKRDMGMGVSTDDWRAMDRMAPCCSTLAPWSPHTRAELR